MKVAVLVHSTTFGYTPPFSSKHYNIYIFCFDDRKYLRKYIEEEREKMTPVTCI